MEMTSFVPFALLGAAVLLLIIFFYYVPFLLWISAKVSGVNISLIQLFLMRIRKVPPYIITRAMIEAHKAGLKTLTRDELEAHYLAGGHVEKVVHALVSASKANIDLPFQMATAIDLAGRDVFEAVQMSVNPKVINTPPSVHQKATRAYWRTRIPSPNSCCAKGWTPELHSKSSPSTLPTST